ncbi:HNH endonuclease [uncultured Rubinisphaera sp.]|uniref:HNH endonuclease n=1 Tax=uncultured Rubinisphaera sp. TaxID=1678686 RepID=UPI0030D7498E|tara:strand:+ start:29 stop:559 length:531 start_codon:yes stop_codon:yes gene_type:complete
MSELLMLDVCEESTRPASHYKGPNPIDPEEALRVLRAEIEQAIEHLATHPINGSAVVTHVNSLTRLLTGKARQQRKVPNAKRVKPVFEKYEPRDILPMQVKVSRYRQQLLSKGGCRCVYCGCKCTQKNGTMDHVQPVSKGGPDSPFNLVMCCHRCNQVKGARTVEEWAADILSVSR